jgi:hypothetical protein
VDLYDFPGTRTVKNSGKAGAHFSAPGTRKFFMDQMPKSRIFNVIFSKNFNFFNGATITRIFYDNYEFYWLILINLMLKNHRNIYN